MAVCAAAAVPCINDGRPPAAAAAVAARLSSRRRRTSLAKFRLLYTQNTRTRIYAQRRLRRGKEGTRPSSRQGRGGQEYGYAPLPLRFAFLNNVMQQGQSLHSGKVIKTLHSRLVQVGKT